MLDVQPAVADQRIFYNKTGFYSTPKVGGCAYGMILIQKREIAVIVSSSRHFDINRHNMPETRTIGGENAAITVQQFLARNKIEDLAEESLPFAQLYLAGSPYRRDMLGYYPSNALGRFIIETHIATPRIDACSEAYCGAVVYDRGFLRASGLVEREEFADPDKAYEWVAGTLRQFAGRIAEQNPLIGEGAATYLAEMQEQGHEFVELHNQAEMNFALNR